MTQLWAGQSTRCATCTAATCSAWQPAGWAQWAHHVGCRRWSHGYPVRYNGSYDNDNGNSRSFIVIVPLDQPARGAGGPGSQPANSTCGQSHERWVLGTHQYYGPQRASSIDTRCNHNLKMPFVPVLCVRWAVAAAPGAAQPGWIHNFCNGQMSRLLDPTERLRCYHVIDGVFVTQTLHVCWYHTCICPLSR